MPNSIIAKIVYNYNLRIKCVVSRLFSDKKYCNLLYFNVFNSINLDLGIRSEFYIAK